MSTNNASCNDSSNPEQDARGLGRRSRYGRNLGHPSRPVSCLWLSRSLALKQKSHTALCRGHRMRVAWLCLVDRLGFGSHFGQVDWGWRRKFCVRNQHWEQTKLAFRVVRPARSPLSSDVQLWKRGCHYRVGK